MEAWTPRKPRWTRPSPNRSGRPVFGVPYANPDESNHAPNENMEIARFIMGIKTGAAMLTYLGYGKIPEG
jgi:hypothetical protein